MTRPDSVSQVAAPVTNEAAQLAEPSAAAGGELTSAAKTGRDGAAPQVVLGVGGGIAAYKACELVRRLRASGADVTVVPTESA
ncbi:MAG: flavoprotein, partial [Nakamurella sp.]